MLSLASRHSADEQRALEQKRAAARALRDAGGRTVSIRSDGARLLVTVADAELAARLPVDVELRGDDDRTDLGDVWLAVGEALPPDP